MLETATAISERSENDDGGNGNGRQGEEEEEVEVIWESSKFSSLEMTLGLRGHR